MMKSTPNLYLDTRGASKVVRRGMPNGARVAFYLPDLNCVLEIAVETNGTWQVAESPAPLTGEPYKTKAKGRVRHKKVPR